jgi:hypothetical protein
MLIIFLGLIAKLALVCDGCYLGIPNLNNFDWNQVSIIVFIQILKKAPYKPDASVYISFVVY